MPGRRSFVPAPRSRRGRLRQSRHKADHTMDFEQARFNMVEQQIRTWEVLDQEVLDLLFTRAARGLRAAAVPRAGLRGPGAADRRRRAHVGAQARGAGAAVAASSRRRNRCSRSAPAAAISPRCSRAARATSPRSRSTRRSRRRPPRGWRGTASATCAAEVGDGARGFGSELYDVIVLTGSTPVLPESFLAQLKPNGRAVRDRGRGAGDGRAARRLDGAGLAARDHRPVRDGGGAAAQRGRRRTRFKF